MGTTRKPGQSGEGFDIDAKLGKLFGEDTLSGLDDYSKMEVKTDFMYWSTGNVCVELFGRGGRDSGLRVCTAPFFAFSLMEQDGKTLNVSVVCKTDFVREVVERWRKSQGDKNYLTPCGDDNATLGAMIPLKLFLPFLSETKWEPYTPESFESDGI